LPQFVSFLPTPEVLVFHSVALLAIPGTAPFEFGVICEVFGIDRSDSGAPAWDFRVVTAEPGRVPTSLGFDLVVEQGLDAAEDADLIAVPAHTRSALEVDPRYFDVLRRAHERGAWILSVCTGAFVLGRAGLLDGRRATTHWMHTDGLAEQFPEADVDPHVLFVEDGRIVTSAGTAAGIDAALHLVRREHGAAAANVIARRMVVPPQRDGGQAQFIDTPMPEHPVDSLADITAWMAEHLDRELSVDELARRALMSPRTFARRFRAETGTTPAAWLGRQRLLRAQQLLEQTHESLELVAQQAGFGTAAVMRSHFVRVLGTTPTAYRRTFGHRAASVPAPRLESVS
jgi:transcriptional regulator GlxA family with amidase domain